MSDVDFKKVEGKILKFWDDRNIFERSLKQREGKKRFVFFEGPPTANGNPAMHHFIGRVFKDLWPRYKTMRGYYVSRKGGWDTHGLPVEIEVEKELGLKNKKEIEAYGIAKFNARAKASVWKYKDEWQKFTKRIGFWLDMHDPYITYDPKYMESLWWIIKQIDKRGLLYEGHKVLPWCSRCGTALSSHEVAQEYHDITETSVYMKFRLISNFQSPISKQISNPKFQKNFKLETLNLKLYLLAWTTTPWTLPGNVALAVGEKIDYVLVYPTPARNASRSEAGGQPPLYGKGEAKEGYIIAKDRAEAVLGKNYKVIKELKGKNLVGLKYEPLFDIKPLRTDKAHRVYAADFVTTTEGTGIVHTAVMYGEDDYELGKKLGLPMHHTVNEDGTFTKDVPEFAGQSVKDSEKGIVEYLKTHNLVYKVEPYTHSYPFCWRCKRPLLYYARNSWFIAMSKLRKDLLKNNKKIHWHPEHLKDGRFGEFLREVKNWAFSRERYWGTPLPVWKCIKCTHQRVIGSLEELGPDNQPKNESGELDLHRPYIDEVTLKCEKCPSSGSGQACEMKRVKEVCDVWFDSGSMPFAQWHYPFENEKLFNDNFPAEFIAEGVDQTRGWFYTLLAVSTLLGKEAPYKNVVCYSHVLDEKGRKMSKSVGNIVNPWDVIEQYGVDATRWYFYSANNPGDPKLFATADVGKRLHGFIMTLMNSLHFFELYDRPAAEIAEVRKPLRHTEPKANPQTALDRWILSRLHGIIGFVTKELDQYNPTTASRAIEAFVTDDLSNWWIRRSRGRFSGRTADFGLSGPTTSQDALSFLRYLLVKVSKLCAPFTPFVAEHIYKRVANRKESVHLEDWPRAQGKYIDKKLEEAMVMVCDVVAAGLAERKRLGIKVRQPLASLTTKYEIYPELAVYIKDELNIKQIFINAAQEAVAVLDEKITAGLAREGLAREAMRRIQDLRKEAKYQIDEKISARWRSKDKNVIEMMGEWNERIAHDTLLSPLEKMTVAKGIAYDIQAEFDLAPGARLWLGLKK